METLKTLLAILLPLAAYFGLMRLVARLLPATDTSRQWVELAYWGSVAFVLSYWLAYVLGGWVIRFESLFIGMLVLSGWLAGVRARQGEASAALSGWLTFHGWGGLPMMLVVGLIWTIFTHYEPVFRNRTASVELVEDFTLSDTQSWTLTFYQRNNLYEVEAGHFRTGAGVGPDCWRREWWQDVQDVSFDAPAQTVTIRKYDEQTVTLNYQQ